MGLDDVALLIAPNRPDVGRRLLMAFYGRPHGLTRDEILQATGLNRKMFEYFLTKLRLYRLVQGTKDRGVYRYVLTPDAFHARMDTLFVDAVKNLGAL